MAYYSGTATSLANLLANFLTNAQADGWTLTGSVLSKAGVFFQLTSDANNVKCLGCESNAVANPAPNVVSVGRIYQDGVGFVREVAFPCNYEVFGFAQEIYLIINYSVDSYQWLVFGKSTVPGLAGQGGFCSASVGVFAANGFGSYPYPVNMSSLGGQAAGARQTTPAPFWKTEGGVGLGNGWINHGLDGHGWTWNGNVSGETPIGIRHMTPLLDIQPNVWNSEAVLLPVRAYKERPSYKSSLLLDLQYARHLRIDNLAPGDILIIGSDKWKVFPFYKKNAAVRNAGSSVDHTGTFGWAIKYEGP